MKKVIVQYDEGTGQIYDCHGVPTVSWVGLRYEEVPDNLQSEVLGTNNKFNEIMAMSATGMTVEDIITLKDKDLI